MGVAQWAVWESQWGRESRSGETFHGCILQPRLARLLNKQLIESKLRRADGGGAASPA